MTGRHPTRLDGARLALAAAVFAAAAGCTQAPAPAPQAAAPSGPAKVTVVRPERKKLVRVVEQPGVVRADEEAPLFARVTGYVAKVHADIGSRVKAGQVLAEVDVPELAAEGRQKAALVRQAEAEVEQSKKGLAAAGAGVAAGEAAAAEARAGLKKAQANSDRWESEARRMAGLQTSGAVDAQTRDEAENQSKAAAAARDEAQARIGTADAMTRKAAAERDKAGADVLAAEAKVGVARADAERVGAMLAYARVAAPFDGVVTRRAVDTGHLLRPDRADPLFVVSREDRVRVSVEVPESDAPLVRDGARVAVVIPSLKSLSFEGKVARTAWGLTAGSRTLRTEVDLPNTDGRLRPGLYVVARVSAELPETFALPAAALAKQGDATVCFLVDGGKAVRTPVQTGRTEGEFTQVLKLQRAGSPAWSDVTGGEAVASPAASLADGQAVDAGSTSKQ